MNSNTSDMKFDKGKVKAACLFEYFPHALNEVARVATYGAEKYARGSWVDVPNKEERYSDAYFRHILAGYMGEKIDEESGLAHKAHAAWNALALLQMELEKDNKVLEKYTSLGPPMQVNEDSGYYFYDYHGPISMKEAKL